LVTGSPCLRWQHLSPKRLSSDAVIMVVALLRAAGSCASKQRGGQLCQPWFYLRLEAYCFFGLSEGAYGGP